MNTPKKYIAHTKTEIDGIRAAAIAASEILQEVCSFVRPNQKTNIIDQYAALIIKQKGAKSATLGYRGFPGHCCISINDEVVHGFGKSHRMVRSGDLVTIDIAIKYKNFIGDNAKTIGVSSVSDEAQRLMDVTQECLSQAIDVVRIGNNVRDVGFAIQNITNRYHYGIVRAFTGHGCGVKMHEPPQIPNAPTKKNKERFRKGMILAIEPMITAGTWQVVVDDDRWTARTTDKSLSAHFERMILVTDGDPEILTNWI